MKLVGILVTVLLVMLSFCNTMMSPPAWQPSAEQLEQGIGYGFYNTLTDLRLIATGYKQGWMYIDPTNKLLSVFWKTESGGWAVWGIDLTGIRATMSTATVTTLEKARDIADTLLDGGWLSIGEMPGKLKELLITSSSSLEAALMALRARAGNSVFLLLVNVSSIENTPFFRFEDGYVWGKSDT